MFGAIWALISGVAVVTDKIKGTIKNYNSKEKAKQNKLIGKNDAGTYFDSKGKERDIETNQLRMTMIDSDTKDLWLMDTHMHKIKNLSEEKRLRERKDQIFNDNSLHSVIKYNKGYNSSYDHVWNSKTGYYTDCWRVVGFRYQDIKTGRIYVERKFDNMTKDKMFNVLKNWPREIKGLESIPWGFHATFYMDIETGELVRVSDTTLLFFENEKDKAKRLGEKYEMSFNIGYCNSFIELFNKYQRNMKKKYDLTQHDEFDKFYWNYNNYT